jgi:replication factor C subunit 1
MSDIWIDKYRPKNIKEIIGNTTNIDKIDKWIKNEKSNMSLVISGYHGIGKNLIVRKILEKNNYNYKWLDYKDEKGKSLFDDLVNCFTGENLRLMNSKKDKFVLVINDVDKITLKNEKARIKDLVKLNHTKKYFPIIFISSLLHNKLLTDILEFGDDIKLKQPSNIELTNFLNKIIKNENINIKDDKVKSKIIKFCQNDVRRLILILYDLKNSFDVEDEINVDLIKYFINNSEKKCKDVSLFDSSKTLINKYTNINDSLSMYRVDKVLVPLTIHENFTKSIFNKYSDNNIYLEILSNVTDSISRGDVIETNIYTDQNWFLHDIHGFYTCVKTSYNINKYNKIYKDSFYDMRFSSDLNQTSLKNINKKQISNLSKMFPNKSFNDIINLNKIIFNLVKNDKIKELYNIMKDYDNNIKTVENIIKIDKTMDKITISQKNKKLFNSFVKNKS